MVGIKTAESGRKKTAERGRKKTADREEKEKKFQKSAPENIQTGYTSKRHNIFNWNFACMLSIKRAIHWYILSIKKNIIKDVKKLMKFSDT